MLRRSWSATDPGRMLTVNHDGLFANDEFGVYAVVDGVGGDAGEFASRFFIQALTDKVPTLRAVAAATVRASDPGRARRDVFDALQHLLEHVNGELYGWSRDDPNLRGGATTATLMVLSPGGVFVGHVGDSRAYVLRAGQLQRLTEDHTLVEEMVRVGKLRREETGSFRYRNVVVRTLGDRAMVKPDLLYVDAAAGDTFLLCTDGLTDFAADAEIQAALAEPGVMRPAQKLMELAHRGGGGDNVTAVVVHLPQDEVLETRVASIEPFHHTMKLAMLKHLFFCQHLTDEERMKVLRYVHEVQVMPGGTVVRQGENGQDLYLVVQGSVDVVVDGTKVTVIGTGGHFGEIALVSGQKRTATVVAREAVRLFKIGRDDFFDLSQRDQAVAVKMLWAFTQTLAGRVMALSKTVAAGAKTPAQ